MCRYICAHEHTYIPACWFLSKPFWFWLLPIGVCPQVCAGAVGLGALFWLSLMANTAVATVFVWQCVAEEFCHCMIVVCAVDDDCFFHHSWSNNVVIAFMTLSSFCLCACVCLLVFGWGWVGEIHGWTKRKRGAEKKMKPDSKWKKEGAKIVWWMHRERAVWGKEKDEVWKTEIEGV